MELFESHSFHEYMHEAGKRAIRNGYRETMFNGGKLLDNINKHFRNTFGHKKGIGYKRTPKFPWEGNENDGLFN